MSETLKDRYLIQIDRSHVGLDMEHAQLLLEPLGVEVDPHYGPICINRKLGRYVVRGVASPEARLKAERLEYVRFFADAKIAPIKTASTRRAIRPDTPKGRTRRTR